MSSENKVALVNKRLFQCSICMVIFAACIATSAIDDDTNKRVFASLVIFWDGVVMGWLMVLLAKTFRG